MSRAVESLAGRIEACRRLLVEAASQGDMKLTGDGRLSEPDVARLLGYSAGWLKAMRAEGTGPTAYSRGLDGHRVSYRLTDVAAWIESSRDGP